MNCKHGPTQCFIVPPYMIDRLAENADVDVRRSAIEATRFSAALRAARDVRADAPRMSAIPSAAGTLERRLHDAQNRVRLPGALVRSEGAPSNGDLSADRGYDYSGIVHDFYSTVFGRNSLDGRGMALVSSVHVGRLYNNAFWNGEQMAYGDGGQHSRDCRDESSCLHLQVHT